MKYSYFARQPIMDVDKQTIGYELLFRDGPKNSFPNIDADLATIRLLSDHILTTKQDTLGDLLGFINFPYQSLIDDIPSLFPPSNLIIEILEDCPPTDALLQRVKQLYHSGYTLALDDFVPAPEWQPFLPYVHIIKFDIRTISIGDAREFIRQHGKNRLRYLAEKVETAAEFELAKNAGFDYFQGYFFSKPEVVQKKALEPSMLTVLQLLVEVAKPEIRFDQLEKLVARDVTLSYKLLSYVNASANVTSKIQSFHQALVYLGEDRLRKFISLVALASNDNDKPDYLYSLSIQRAKFCELLATQVSPAPQSSHAFLTGMFSLIDCLLDRPLDQVVNQMPVDSEVQGAILEKRGTLGGLLVLAKAIERARWDKVTTIGQRLRLNDEQVFNAYDAAIAWTAELMDVDAKAESIKPK
ncbi:EAL and HDOD domain-containing protein [Vibrio panuliri]|uniref:Histidine kinase n=1 Tax=Vibrio panuliri TaxID=1381081 RepID=A0A1Q9HE13_9VIBR|nr:HDOD domain-containing protein [Vibrio panuliri]KAB1454893.1 EAL domain-containing protein [Vibrio panuliri]OLQ87941.1 histidine kinase [Vibrio panuliri]OLQ95262.1 histidine kinase [Vibrio panuliri]